MPSFIRDEFRTAPLWGLGQRLFFLHDGYQQFGPSEANKVIANFNGLPQRNQQNLLNFLRSL